MTIPRNEFFEHMDRMEASIKLHLDNKIEPISDKLNNIQTTLYGADGRTGVVGDVNDLKTSIKTTVNNAKAMGGLLGALGGMIAGLWHKIF